MIAADGMWSPTRKALGVGEPGYLGEWHAFRQYARNVTGPAAERLIVWFEPDLLPGYMWSFPLPDGRANIGFGVQRNGVRRIADMKTEWEDLLQRPHVVEALGAGVRVGGPPHRVADSGRHRPRHADGWSGLLRRRRGDGHRHHDRRRDRAGVADRSPGCRGDRSPAARSPPAEVAKTYRSTVRHHLLADHKMSALLSKVLASEMGARGPIRVLAGSEWSRRNFARWMFEDEPRAIAVTPCRWHRHLFHQPAPYRPLTPIECFRPAAAHTSVCRSPGVDANTRSRGRGEAGLVQGDQLVDEAREVEQVDLGGALDLPSDEMALTITTLVPRRSFEKQVIGMHVDLDRPTAAPVQRDRCGSWSRSEAARSATCGTTGTPRGRNASPSTTS